MASACFSPTALRTTLAVLLVLTLLDARDVWFKGRWLGSDDAGTRVVASSTMRLLPQPLEASRRNPNDAPTSGVVSFLERCEGMEAFASPASSFFHARLRRCQLEGSGNDSSVETADVIAATSVRVDSMAWAACQLLSVDRRPPLCHEALVLEFPRRVPGRRAPARSSLAAPMSPAEAELQLLLEVLSQSAPLSSVVCIEGIPSTNTTAAGGLVESSLFGCASPSTGRAAFVGTHATGFAALQRDLAWLTVLDLQVFGLHFEYLQHATSRFHVEQGPKHVELTHEMSLSMVSSGALFRLMLTVDVLLLFLHAMSAWELAHFVLSSTANEDEAGAEPSELSPSFLLTSLYRSAPVVALTTLSALLSWFLVVPCSMIWTYSSSVSLQLHAVLTVVRLWVLPLFVCRATWDTISWLREALAFSILRFTYVSSVELWSIFAFIVVVSTRYLGAIRDALLFLTSQRLHDASAFKSGVIVRSSAYNDAQDASAPLLSDRSAFAVLFTPLLLLVVLTAVATALLIAVRFFVNARREQGSSPASAYVRLPAEELLSLPIRARQLVRGSLALELVVSQRLNTKWLRVDQWLEVGVLLRDDQWLQTRRGFVLGLVQPKVHAGDGHAVIGTQDDGDGAGDGSDSPTKRRRKSAHVPSLR
ncbi:hypothetical protein P43SY_001217 [Pythium insidiosum]|uniref:Transmembrane protein n=1 Tax=Pythium insidiosum TaxID=114742 RepID=A0AAD5LDH6_PYTIN|nr:hypothetical protein P43SY_001217 [Pythium insidiosum]